MKDTVGPHSLYRIYLLFGVIFKFTHVSRNDYRQKNEGMHPAAGAWDEYEKLFSKFLIN